LKYIKKTYETAKKNDVKKFIILVIPSIYDFNNLKKISKPRALNYWEKELFSLAKENRDFIYIDGFKAKDLVKNSNKSYLDFFLPCDGHWNVYGSLQNAELINKKL